ncbi:TadE/TadG family type IV pilus assembly protein [Tropicibacter naphthalenivorans]|uniref:Flp pilus assembly protein TadG n=1 Tax=Tropicibacter naphthalenivorans TaxID=441103 RepID=A0A0P1G8H9_9RHOB|nr:hypothetical protein [Tropicibacter naphthalenivorans]CUH77862.1 hypothetical protein TRN7648_01659 [Tropicibacter naphthalenivorans]SMC95349.1 TadE-like protein [Tropicibacter naphthalenivorans]
MLKTFLASRLRRFARSEEGNMTIEALIWIPLIIALLAATFTFHDAFRYKSLNVKAAYTISDALSRETDPIDNAYLDGMVDLLEFLTRGQGPYSLRVTLVRYNGTDTKFESEWSQGRGEFAPLTDADLVTFAPKLPNLLHNERVILVETSSNYQPPFEIPGLVDKGLFYNFGFTRPRFAPKIVWSDA